MNGWSRHLHRPRARPLADHDVEIVVLHRRIEGLLDRRAHPVHFVDEQHVTRLEVGHHRREIAGLLDDRAGGRADLHAQLVGDHVRERRLAEPGRTVQQHVIERFAALPRRRDRHLQVLADAVLPDVVVERPRAQARLVLDVFVHARGGDEAIVHGHAVTRLAEHQRFSAGRSAVSNVASGDRRQRPVERPFPPRALIPEVQPAPTTGRHAVVRRPTAPAFRRSLEACGSRSFSSSPIRSAVFLPTPGILVSRATSLPAHRAHQLRGLDAREHRQRELRPDAVDRRSAVRTDRARARVANPYSASASSRTCVCTRSCDRRACFAKRIERRQRHLHVVADAADVDDDAARRPCPGACRGDGRSSAVTGDSRRLRASSRSARPVDALGSSRAPRWRPCRGARWQIATASASAASCGVGTSSSPSSSLTICCTCGFSARP